MGSWAHWAHAPTEGKGVPVIPAKGCSGYQWSGKAWLCRAHRVLGMAAAWWALLEGRSASEGRKVKEQGGWSFVSWNLATGLHWAFLHLQKLPWYFNNCGWFNGSSGRQQHWDSWVCATHITAHSFVVRQCSFRNQGEPILCLLVYQHVHMCCQVCPSAFPDHRCAGSPACNVLHL